MLATMQQFVDKTTDGKQINYDVQYNIICCFSVVVWRELGGCCVVGNQCVGRHVDSHSHHTTPGRVLLHTATTSERRPPGGERAPRPPLV